MKKILKQVSANAIALNPENFSEHEKQTKWIGKLAATESEITEAEKKLGIALPDDVKEFYKISNGTSEILSHTFSGFDAIKKIDWLKNLQPETIEAYAAMGEDYENSLKNSIVISGANHVHQVVIIQPYGKYTTWRYWEFATYIPGETEFKGIEKYLERINDFLEEQIKNKAETLGQ